MPRNREFRSLEIPSLSALPTRPSLPPLFLFPPFSHPSAFPFLSFPFVSSPLFSFLFAGSRPSRPRPSRRKSSTGVIRRYRARYPGYGTPPPVRCLVHTRARAHTHARNVPVNAPPMCAAVVPINRREIFIGMGCFQSRPALSALSALRASARPDASRFRREILAAAKSQEID